MKKEVPIKKDQVSISIPSTCLLRRPILAILERNFVQKYQKLLTDLFENCGTECRIQK